METEHVICTLQFEIKCIASFFQSLPFIFWWKTINLLVMLKTILFAFVLFEEIGIFILGGGGGGEFSILSNLEGSVFGPMCGLGKSPGN